MVSVIVRMKFAPEDREQVAEILRNLGTASRQEPGCLHYVTHTLEDDPDAVLIYEQFRDSAAMDAHRQSPHFKTYAVGGLYQLMKSRSIEGLTAVY